MTTPSEAATVKRETRTAEGIRFSVEAETGEIARAYLYIMHNDLHEEPFGLLEDVYVDESQRGAGIGTRLVRAVIDVARETNCCKLIATSRASRPKVHEFCERLGFRNYGVEFRMDFSAG